MTTLERGFKAWAERTAATIRADLSLAPTAPLDPLRLAAHLGVTLVRPDQIEGMPAEICAQLLVQDRSGWSAATLELDGKTTIIFNPRKSAGRRASDIVHELAHLILGHEPAKIVFSQDGQLATRTFDQKQEDEANWLAWALLLPRDALFAAKRSRMLTAQIATAYGVTETLVSFRLKMTGVDVQFRHRAGHRGA
jgi:Zn-dependent peptidase ImmA (M78 family)